MKPLKIQAAIFGFCAGLVFTFGVAFGFRLPIWPWCLLVIPAQVVVQSAASAFFYFFCNQGGT